MRTGKIMFGDGFLWAAGSFRGRLSQGSAFLVATCLTLASAACIILYYYTVLDYMPSEPAPELVRAILFETLPTGWLLYAVNVKRLHDFGFSGWWALAGLAPGIGDLIWIIYLVPGTGGPNRYGRDTNSSV
ncbi:DUF805 domain-containing protein [Limoniibacter endophyticus]